MENLYPGFRFFQCTLVAVMIEISISIMISIESAALLASFSELMPALLRLTTVLAVLSNLLVKFLFSLANALFAVAAPVCPQGRSTAEQATAQHK